MDDDTQLVSHRPRSFFECVAQDAPDADLLFVCGTSLAVGPANTLPSMVCNQSAHSTPVGAVPGNSAFARVKNTNLMLYLHVVAQVNAPRILVNRDDVRHAMGEPRPDDMWLPGERI